MASTEQVSTFFSPFYEDIPVKKLRKMQFIEGILCGLALFELICVCWIFYTLDYGGIIATSPKFEMNEIIWHLGIIQAYDLTWVLIACLGLMIWIRKYFHDVTKIPVTERRFLPDESKPTEKESLQTPLRNNIAYIFVICLDVAMLFGYLQYFPRAEGLFPTYTLINDSDYATLTNLSDFTTFEYINLIFIMSLGMADLFLMLFSIRQIKDIHLTVSHKIEKHEEIPEEQLDWKPSLPKPWKYMTIEERKTYQMQVLELEKQRSYQIQEVRFKKLVEDERAKRRLGEKHFKQNQREKKKSDQKKIKQKKSKSIEQDKFDFR